MKQEIGFNEELGSIHSLVMKFGQFTKHDKWEVLIKKLYKYMA